MNLLRRLWLVRRLRSQLYGWDRAALLRHQRERATKVLAHARAHSHYYRRILATARDLSDVPVMTKAEMMAHFDEINTAGLFGEELVHFRIGQERQGRTDLYRGEYSVGLSSGTSGSRGLTVLSRDETKMYGCLLYARSGIPEGVSPRRVLFTLRTNNPSFMEPRSFGVKIVYADYNHSPEEFVALINDKRLNVLAGPPSLLSTIADLSGSIGHRIDGLISYAEVLDDLTRSRLQRAFSAPVSQIYQGGEGFIAATCRRGRLHLNEDVLLFEQADSRGATEDAKRLLVTDLYRTTQPLIRYALDDVVELDPEPCPCGSCFQVVKLIHGRADEILLLRPLPATASADEVRRLYPDYVRRSIDQSSDAILEYQAVQHSMDEIEIRLALRQEADRAQVERTILDNLAWRAERAGGVLPRVCFTAKPLERNPRSGKLIRVIRKF